MHLSPNVFACPVEYRLVLFQRRPTLTRAEAFLRIQSECFWRLKRRISLLMDLLMALCSVTSVCGTTFPVRHAVRVVRLNAYRLLTLAVRVGDHAGVEFGETRMVPMDLA